MKKKWKSTASVLLCAVLTFGAFSLSGCSRQTGNSDKVLKVGMECNYAPFNWSQQNDSNGAVRIANGNEYANGYDVMMAKKIAQEMGCELEIVKTKWSGLSEGVSTGKLDAAIAGMSITADRLKTVDFSDVYYKASMYALVKKGGKFENAKGIADLKGAVCTSQQSTAWYDLLPQIPEANIQPALADVPTMIVSLKSGKCDLLLVDKPTAMAASYANSDLAMIDLENDRDLKVSDEVVNMGIAVKKGNAELKDAINKALAGISEDDRQKLMDEAIKDQPLAQ